MNRRTLVGTAAAGFTFWMSPFGKAAIMGRLANESARLCPGRFEITMAQVRCCYAQLVGW